ncbi:hypothetical protein D9M70_601950 [compost metagenome]
MLLLFSLSWINVAATLVMAVGIPDTLRVQRNILLTKSSMTLSKSLSVRSTSMPTTTSSVPELPLLKFKLNNRRTGFAALAGMPEGRLKSTDNPNPSRLPMVPGSRLPNKPSLSKVADSKFCMVSVLISITISKP